MTYNLSNEIKRRATKSVYRDGDSIIKLFVENYNWSRQEARVPVRQGLVVA